MTNLLISHYINKRPKKSTFFFKSEASYMSEAIPLLPKDTSLITYEADRSHYSLLTVIGKGLNESASVFMAKHIPTGQNVAVRRINLDSCIEDITYVQNEILVTRQLKHENLLPYYCSFVCNNEVWTIMPLITYGSAKDIIFSHFPNGLPEFAIALILRDTLFALDYIHKRGYIHRSIKASHILISSSGRAVLSGLRYSCNVINKGRWHHAIHSFPHDSISNLYWLSPEVLEQNLLGYNAKSDVYSLGITACELANGTVPFADVPPTQMLLEKLQGFHPRPLDAQTLLHNNDDGPKHQGIKFWRVTPSVATHSQHQPLENSYQTKHFSETFHGFTEVCLQRDPMRRPSAAQLQSHSFIKQCKKMNVTLQDILTVVSPLADLSTAAGDNSASEIAEACLQELTLEEPWNF